MAIARIVAFLGLVAFAPAPFAAMLYKSIASNGVVQFSDTPPESGVILEERPIPSRDADGAAESNIQPLGQLTQLADGDAELARANAKMDLAEHAFALARRSMWSSLDGLRLAAAPQRTRADEERARYFMHNVVAARQNLLAVLKDREAN